MIRKGTIVLLSLLAITTAVIWVVGRWYVIIWRDKNHTDLPVISVSLGEGACIVDRVCHVPKVTRQSESGWAVLGFGAATIRILTMRVSDEPAGFTVRRIQPLFDEDGMGPYLEGVQFVVITNVQWTLVRIPLWLLLTLFAAYPATAFIRGPLRRWRRRRKGRCLTCGYNLTGNVSGVCPECGVSLWSAGQ